MTWKMRVTSSFLERIRADLARSHAFAAERIGFTLCRLGSLDGGESLILPFEYQPVPDHQYLRDTTVGARINGDAIRTGMAAALAGDTCVLHTHMHEHVGRPRFSEVDLANYPALVRALQAAGPHAPHGALLLSEDSADCLLWRPGSSAPESGGQLTIVGRPMSFLSGGTLYA